MPPEDESFDAVPHCGEIPIISTMVVINEPGTSTDERVAIDPRHFHADDWDKAIQKNTQDENNSGDAGSVGRVCNAKHRPSSK